MFIKTRYFKCEHPFEPENQVKIGKHRVGCRTCRTAHAWRRIGKAQTDAGIVQRVDPDTLLRRF